MRRTRYTVTLANHETPKVILTYGPDHAANYFRDRGYTVVSVTKGDYRKTRRPASGARPLLAEVRAAAETLGITLPIDVRVRADQSNVHGSHQFRRDARGRLFHKIMVKDWLTAEEMGRTLWHELAHAKQGEAFLGEERPEWAFHRAYRDGSSYSRKRFEVDAREHEPLNDDWPLAR